MGKRICFFGVMKEDIFMHLAKLAELTGLTAVIVDRSRNSTLFAVLGGNDLLEDEEFVSGRIYNNGITVVKPQSNYDTFENEFDISFEYYGFNSGYSGYDRVVYLVDNSPVTLKNVMNELNRWDNRNRATLILRETFYTGAEEKYVVSLLGIPRERCFSAHYSEEDSRLKKRIGYSRNYRLKKIPLETREMVCAIGESLEFGEYDELKKMIKREGKRKWGKSLSSGHRPEEAVA